MRIAGLMLLTAALALLLGCPQPIENTDGTTPDDGGAVSADVSMHRSGDADAPDDAATAGLDTVDDDQGTGDEAQDDTGEGTDDPAEPAPSDADPEHAADADINGDELPVIFQAPLVPEPETPEAVEPDPEDEEVPTEEEAPVVVEEPAEPHGALDPGRMLAGEPDEPEPAFSEPAAPRISHESYAFAGEWTVAVIHQDGRAGQLPADDAWTFNLGDDGKCSVTQVVDREEWTQRGGWEYVGDELTLRLGPGGQRSYEVFQPEEDPDIAVLTDDYTGAVLFCLRVDPAVRVPKPAKHYESDFGAVDIRQSGQVYWSGTYGEPEGRLNFRMTGQYMTGTWEQAPGNGFVLLKLTKDGFSGWWWYEASTEFDGTWRGSAK